MKHDSHCIICKAPATAPRGNWNAHLVTLCGKKSCRRLRKTQLQKERRKQLDLFQPAKLPSATRVKKMRTRFVTAIKQLATKAGAKKDARKRKFFGQDAH